MKWPRVNDSASCRFSYPALALGPVIWMLLQRHQRLAHACSGEDRFMELLDQSNEPSDPSELSLKQALRRGELRVGTFVKSPSVDMVELLALSGMDFIIADAEHGPIDPHMCQQMARAAQSVGVPLVVRVGAGAIIGPYLDTGVAGAQLPMVNAVEDAEYRVAALFHPPVGNRGLANARWSQHGTGARLPDLVQRVSDELTVIVQVEDLSALDCLDDLLRLPLPDVYFIGPTDLSSSMGFGGDRKHPEVAKAIRSAISKIVGAGRTAGIACTPDDVHEYVALGVRYVALGGESLLVSAAKAAVASCRRAMDRRNEVS